MVTLLSKINANLSQFAETKTKSIDLYLPDPTKRVIHKIITEENEEINSLNSGFSINDSIYSKSLQTPIHKIISYHISPNYNSITLY